MNKIYLYVIMFIFLISYCTSDIYINDSITSDFKEDEEYTNLNLGYLFLILGLFSASFLTIAFIDTPFSIKTGFCIIHFLLSLHIALFASTYYFIPKLITGLFLLINFIYIFFILITK